MSGNLSQYATFYEQNKDYISSIGNANIQQGSTVFVLTETCISGLHVGLDHEQNMRKMRLLTLMQMCEGKTELDYNFVQDELKFDGQDDLEMFIIEGQQNVFVRNL